MSRGKGGEADDGIHGSADVMGQIVQEVCFRLIGVIRQNRWLFEMGRNARFLYPGAPMTPAFIFQKNYPTYSDYPQRELLIFAK